MAQTAALIKSLKKALKAHGLTYAEVASGLGMSEANVKRMFSEQRFYLGVFDDICQLMGMEISELAKQVERESQSLEQLTEKQERELVANPKLLVVMFLVINGVTFREIVDNYLVKEAETVGYFTQLDKLKIIELLPNNRVKLLISPNFSWRHAGPIAQFFSQYLQQDFLDHPFDQPGESLYFLSGIITKESRQRLITRLNQFAKEFNDYNHADAKQPFSERKVTSLILAVRAWKPKVFDKYRRES